MARGGLVFAIAVAIACLAACEKPFTLAAGGEGGTSVSSTGTSTSVSTGTIAYSVECGTNACDAPDICCIPKPGGAKHCEKAVLDCSNSDIAAACDGPEDCIDKLCCYDSGDDTTTCRSSCGNDDRVCHEGSECPSPNVCVSNGFVKICA